MIARAPDGAPRGPFGYACDECGERRNHRPLLAREVPRLGGQRGHVCIPCAGDIDLMVIRWWSQVDRGVRAYRTIAA